MPSKEKNVCALKMCVNTETALQELFQSQDPKVQNTSRKYRMEYFRTIQNIRVNDGFILASHIESEIMGRHERPAKTLEQVASH